MIPLDSTFQFRQLLIEVRCHSVININPRQVLVTRAKMIIFSQEMGIFSKELEIFPQEMRIFSQKMGIFSQVLLLCQQL